MSLSPSEDEKAPMPELSLSTEIVAGEQNSMQQQKSNGISNSKLKQRWVFLRNPKQQDKKKKKPGTKPSKPDKSKRIKKVKKPGISKNSGWAGPTRSF